MLWMLAPLVVTLGLANPAHADPPKMYSIDTAGTTTSLKAGASGLLRVAIKPAEGHYISPEAPLKVTLAGESVTLAKGAVGRADLDDPKSKSPSFKVALTAPAKAGEGKITADLTFYLCNETLCERRTEKVTLAVSVTP